MKKPNADYKKDDIVLLKNGQEARVVNSKDNKVQVAFEGGKGVFHKNWISPQEIDQVVIYDTRDELLKTLLHSQEEPVELGDEDIIHELDDADVTEVVPDKKGRQRAA